MQATLIAEKFVSFPEIENLTKTGGFIRISGFYNGNLKIKDFELTATDKEDLIFKIALKLRNCKNDLIDEIKFIILQDKEFAICDINKAVLKTCKLK